MSFPSKKAKTPIEKSKDSHDKSATLMGYDGAGNLKWSSAGLPSTQACEANGTTAAVAARRVDRTWDGRRALRTLSFAGGVGNQSWTYTPDSLPATITTNNTSGGTVVTNAYSYNKRRLMVSESVKRGAAAAWAIGYSYNSNAHLATLTYPSGLAVSYAPNALGQPTQAGSYATGVSYYPNGAIKQFSYGNGIVHTLAQNTRGLPARSTDCTISGTCALANRRLDLQYAYDGHGNVTAITDHTSSAKQTRAMSYDGLDRLTQTTSPTAVFNSASYSYDQLDNLLTVNVTGGSQARNHTYVYDATTKRLSQVKNTVGGAIVANLTYDVQGNLATKGVQSYQFDLGNRLRSVPNKETGYEYDGHGRRVYALTVGSSSNLSQYAHSGQVLYQQNNKQSKRIDYIYLGNSLVAYRERPLSTTTVTLKYQHTDALGSPIAVTNTAKTTIESSEYEPFGQLVNKPLFDGPGYTGHVQDAATGLTYMQQRYYDPGIGRFLSVDPVTAYSNPVGAFNRYWYANNNPYKFTDPDGRAIQALWGAPVGAIVDILAQKLADPDKSIDWKSVGVSTAVGAVSGGVASIARVAAVRGAATVGQAVIATAGTNAAVGAVGSAADSAVHGETPKADKMLMSAAVNGGLSLAAGLSGAKGILVEKMTSGSPSSPQGIGDYILRTTQSVGGSTASTSAVQGAASAGGRVADIAKETALSTAQKKAEETNN